MKLQSNSRDLEISDGLEQKAFKIEQNSMAFDILSSKLYSDVPRAIIRELSTNAYDAHVANGCKDRPFYVHLPDSLDPYLIIRDYGKGMSPKDIQRIYTTYFASTKRNSDEVIGCFGLGSKSPFAYSDQFAVISRYNGKIYSYSIFKDANGVPSYTLLSEEETDEESGVEIRLAVKLDDFVRFKYAADQVYRWFNVPPLNIDKPQPLLRGNGFEIYRRSIGGVVMGQVLYPAEIPIHVPDFISYNNGIIINANIGECTISASREELQYDEKTEGFLNRKIKEINDFIAQYKEDLYKECNTLYARYLKGTSSPLFRREDFPHMSISSGPYRIYSRGATGHYRDSLLFEDKTIEQIEFFARKVKSVSHARVPKKLEGTTSIILFYTDDSTLEEFKQKFSPNISILSSKDIEKRIQKRTYIDIATGRRAKLKEGDYIICGNDLYGDMCEVFGIIERYNVFKFLSIPIKVIPPAEFSTLRKKYKTVESYLREFKFDKYQVNKIHEYDIGSWNSDNLSIAKVLASNTQDPIVRNFVNVVNAKFPFKFSTSIMKKLVKKRGQCNRLAKFYEKYPLIKYVKFSAIDDLNCANSIKKYMELINAKKR